MRPTLKPGDRLRVLPCGSAAFKRGDVVVFQPPHEKQLIIHRLVSVRGGGLEARGDNNTRPDPWVIPPESIIGRVTHVQRKRGFRRVASGRPGRVYGALIRGVNEVRRRIFIIGRPAYRWIAGRGVLRRLLPFSLPFKVMSITRADGLELRLVLAGRVIGRLSPHDHRWWFRPPFRLLIDERRLPQPEHRHDVRHPH
jgi:hypothetical protein